MQQYIDYSQRKSPLPAIVGLGLLCFVIWLLDEPASKRVPPPAQHHGVAHGADASADPVKQDAAPATSYSLVCVTCREKLDLGGQRTDGDTEHFTGPHVDGDGSDAERQRSQIVERFLLRHVGHALLVDASASVEYDSVIDPQELLTAERDEERERGE
ncbi:MAG: hypothetical protein GC159_11815 [Phycisphaera sp.]|nr:hypothetical protein [Phycisphaera sp.]